MPDGFGRVISAYFKARFQWHPSCEHRAILENSCTSSSVSKGIQNNLIRLVSMILQDLLKSHILG